MVHNNISAGNNENIVMAFPCSDYYVPYLGVALTSLMEHVSPSKNYKIFIMETGISAVNKSRLQSVAAGKHNVSIEFKDMGELIRGLEFITHGHLSRETFFKLMIPSVFSDYKRVLFCDSDILFMADPAELFLTDVGNKKIGAGLCHLWNGMANMRPECMDYARNNLQLVNTDNYFQAGVLLFNNAEISANDVSALVNTANGRKYQFMDQDILNSYFQNDLFIFDSAWNYETPQRSFTDTNKFMSQKNASEYAAAGINPRIIHYSGPHKPWQYTDEARAFDWWQCARRSVFYEDLLTRRACDAAALVLARTHMGRLRIKCVAYRVLRHLCGGPRQKKLRAEYDKLRILIRRAKDLY